MDHGVSGQKTAGRRSTSSLPMWRHGARSCRRLDRLGRNLRHLVMLLDDRQSRGIAFCHAWRKDRHEHPGGEARRRGPRADRGVRAGAHSRARSSGFARVRAQGRRLGRKPCAVSDERFAAVAEISPRGRPPSNSASLTRLRLSGAL